MLGFKRYGVKSDILFSAETVGFDPMQYKRWTRPRKFGKCFLVAVALLYVFTMYVLGIILAKELESGSPQDVSNNASTSSRVLMSN